MEEIFHKWRYLGGWGIKTNEKFSYIHFKYVYDKQNERHVYYLDPETYGIGTFISDVPNEIELNLYEPKITF